MKKLLIIALSCLTASLHAQVSFGKSEKINDNWKFTLENAPEASSVNIDDSQWRQVDLPHDWSVKGQLSPSLASCTGFLPGGSGWYRKSILIPETKKSEKVYLYFEGVYNRSEVYINGKLLGKRPNGYISFMYDATPYVEFGKENIIAVHADHTQSADSRWYTGSGIYRDVYLVYANQVHIAQWGVFVYPTKTNAKQATVNVDVEITNNTKADSKLLITNELLNREGKIVAKSNIKLTATAAKNNKVTTLLNVTKPVLWSLNQPYLYTLKTRVFENGKLIDETTTKTGIRTYTFDPDKGFALNGENMKVKGVCLHHDAGVLGSAAYYEVWKRRLETLKSLGCNAIRTSHNPQAPHLYALCDEIGLLVMNEAFDEWEFPKRKWLEGWNVGTPGFQGTFDFFEAWGERDLADFVKRDRNHISIFAWSIGNEVDYPNDPYSHPVLAGGKETGFTQPIFGGYKKDAPDAMRLGAIAKKLAKAVRDNDPSRPVTAGLAGVAMSNETEYPGALDIAGYNYTESLYENNHKKYPKRVIYGSENRHDLEAWKAVTDNEFIFGQFLWTGIDYLGESGRWPSRGFYSGLVDFAGFIKPRGYFRQSLWSDKPMAYIGTYPTPGAGQSTRGTDVLSQYEGDNYRERRPSMDAWPVWNYAEGQTIRVVAYTNAPKAQLLLNNKVVGETKAYDTETGIIYWDIPYQAGKLEVTGLDKADNIISRYSIQSSKRPYAIKVVDKNIGFDKANGIAQIVLQIVDEDGVPVILADNEISCHIAGKARLLGLEAGNNEDMGNYNDNRQRVYHGKLLAYVQLKEAGAAVKIRFSSPLLQADELTIDAK